MQHYCKEYFENAFAPNQTQSFPHTQMQLFKKCLMSNLFHSRTCISYTLVQKCRYWPTLLHFTLSDQFGNPELGKGKGKRGKCAAAMLFPCAIAVRKKMMMGLRLNIELKGSVPPRDHLHQERQWACYLQTDTHLGLNTLADSVVKKWCRGMAPNSN